MRDRNRSIAAQLEENILLRVVIYYVVLGVTVLALWRWLPDSARAILARPISEVTGGGGLGRAAERLFENGSVTADNVEQGTLALAVFLAALSAVLLALPVAWIYVLTRTKKGYRQSVVHTLIILPLVVAGVVVLVKHSLALAFSLAGIVAAVRFRNTLDDSKDATFLFLSCALGLASGVQVTVGAVLSVTFNLVVIALWYTDFGRTPSALTGARAEERMERAREKLSRTTSFVAAVDDQILKSMSPEQLDALADRAWRRRKRMSPDFEDDERPDFARLLRIRTADPAAIRSAVEQAMAGQLDRWRYGGTVHEENGTHIVEYGVALKRGVPEELLLAAIRERGEPYVLDVELR